MTPGSQPKAHLIISNTGVLCIGEISQTESKMLLIKHKWGTPARGEVREFYRQLARHCNSTFCDGAGPVFVLRTPSGKTVMILLGGKVEDMHRALDGIMELPRGRRNGACQPATGPALRAASAQAGCARARNGSSQISVKQLD